MDDVNKLTGLIIENCIKIHAAIGPGCFEKVYEEILHYELIKLGLEVRRQVVLPIRYEKLHIAKAFHANREQADPGNKKSSSASTRII